MENEQPRRGISFFLFLHFSSSFVCFSSLKFCFSYILSVISAVCSKQGSQVASKPAREISRGWGGGAYSEHKVCILYEDS